MSVLAEALSVIVLCSSIEKKVRGGWSTFMAIVPNNTLCTDQEIARVGFMTAYDVHVFIGELEKLGLIYLENEVSVDDCVFDQFTGPWATVMWLMGGPATYDEVGGEITICALDKAGQFVLPAFYELALPANWKYAQSMSSIRTNLSVDEFSERMKYIRTDNGMEVYLDDVDKTEVYIGRTSKTQ